MKDEFFELIDERVTDRYLEQKFANAAREDYELPDVSRPILEAMIHAQASAFNDAVTSGNAGMAAVHYRAIQTLLDVDDDVAEAFEEMQQNPIQALFGDPGEGGSFPL